MVQIQPRKETLLNAITATAVASRGVGVDNAGKLSLMVYGAVAGSAAFYVEVSNDQTLGYVPYNRLVPNVAGATETRTNILQLTSGTAIIFFPIGDTFNFIRVRGDVWNNASGTAAYTAVLYVN